MRRTTVGSPLGPAVEKKALRPSGIRSFLQGESAVDGDAFVVGP